MTTQPYTQTDLEKSIDLLIDKIWDSRDTSSSESLISEIKKFKSTYPVHVDPSIVKQKLQTVNSFPEQLNTEDFSDLLLTSPEYFNEELLVCFLKTSKKLNDDSSSRLWKFCIDHEMNNLQKTLAIEYPGFLYTTIKKMSREVSGSEIVKDTKEYHDLRCLCEKSGETFQAVLKTDISDVRKSIVDDVRNSKSQKEYCAMFPLHLQHYAKLLNASSASVKEIGKKIVMKHLNRDDLSILCIGFPEIHSL